MLTLCLAGPRLVPGVTMDSRPSLGLLHRTLNREAHILEHDPHALPSHLHNVLLFDEGEDPPAVALLEQARRALAGRAWLRLVNRPSSARSALLRTLALATTALAWSPDGRSLAIGAADGTVYVWDRSGLTGGLRKVGAHREQTLDHSAGHDVMGLAWSADGTLLASGGRDGLALVWDSVSGAVTARIEVHVGAVAAVAWHPEGSALATGGWDRTIRIWDREGRAQRLLEGHRDRVNSLAWSPEGDALASGSLDHNVLVWDGRRQPEVLRDGDGSVDCVVWSPDGGRLASGNGDGRIRIRFRDEETPVSMLDAHRFGVAELAWSPDGSFLASSSQGPDRAVKIWNVAGGGPVRSLSGHTRGVGALAWSPDGDVVASGGADAVRLWDPSRAIPGDLRGHPDYVSAVAWSPGGDRLASRGHEGTVRIWRVDGGDPLVLEHRGIVGAVAWSADGRSVASGAEDVLVFEAASGAERSRLGDRADVSVHALAWRPDGRLLATASSDGRVRLWRPTRARPVAEVEAHWVDDHPRSEECLAWSPDGATLASGGPSDAVRLWRCRRRALGDPRTLKGHRSTVEALAWSADGRLLVSGSRDCVARVWGADGTDGPILRGHRDAVATVACSAGGQLAATGGEDGATKVWDPVSGACLATAYCLSRVAAIQFSDEGDVLRAVDNGAATGNRPVPYVFELCNISSRRTCGWAE